MIELPVSPKKVYINPSMAELRKMTDAMPTTRQTDRKTPNVTTKVLARSKLSTFVVSDQPENHSSPCISRARGEEVAALQNEYIKTKEMIVIDGYIGNDPAFRTAVRLIMEKDFANIAAMQAILFFRDHTINETFKPELTVIYTPGLKAPKDFPEERLIAVDLEKNTTRVFNSDYFGESKKGGLRMWNKIVYDRGGLPLHAGCKIIPVEGKNRVCLVVGLSGTGKTTTTFTKQNNSRPVQDDFVALMPDGRVHATENGCFAKTFGLDEKSEPTIYRAVMGPNAYLENVSQDANGHLDFFDTSYTQNGRAVFAMADIENAADAHEIKRPDFLLILNRNENIIPAVVRLKGAQAAAYFMLGETKGTSAGGAAEAGKSLRVPGTNPFFPLSHGLQGNRFYELLKKINMEVYLMNTGRVGGDEKTAGSKKVKIQHSSAIVKAIAEGTIEWQQDADFGYETAKLVPEFPAGDEDLLNPKMLYEKHNRLDEYREQVKRLKEERLKYLKNYPKLNPELIENC